MNIERALNRKQSCAAKMYIVTFQAILFAMKLMMCFNDTRSIIPFADTHKLIAHWTQMCVQSVLPSCKDWCKLTWLCNYHSRAHAGISADSPIEVHCHFN